MSAGGKQPLIGELCQPNNPKMNMEIKIQRNVGAEILLRLSSLVLTHIHVYRDILYKGRRAQSHVSHFLLGTSLMTIITHP